MLIISQASHRLESQLQSVDERFVELEKGGRRALRTEARESVKDEGGKGARSEGGDSVDEAVGGVSERPLEENLAEAISNLEGLRWQ